MDPVLDNQYFDLVEKLLKHADDFNKALNNTGSSRIAEGLLTVIPLLLPNEEKGFSSSKAKLDFAKKLLEKYAEAWIYPLPKDESL